MMSERGEMRERRNNGGGEFLSSVFCVCSVLGDTVTWDVWLVVSVGDEEGGELRECAAQLLYL